MCDKCGMVGEIHEVELIIDSERIATNSITLDLCEACARELYNEADKIFKEIERRFSNFKVSVMLVELQQEKRGEA